MEAIWTALIHRLLLNSPASSPGLDTSARRRQRISATRRSPPRGGGLNFVISSTLQRLYTRLALLHAPLTSTAGGGSEITTASSLWSPGAVDYSFFPISKLPAPPNPPCSSRAPTNGKVVFFGITGRFVVPIDDVSHALCTVTSRVSCSTD